MRRITTSAEHRAAGRSDAGFWYGACWLQDSSYNSEDHVSSNDIVTGTHTGTSARSEGPAAARAGQDAKPRSRASG